MKKILVIEDQETLRNEICDWFVFEGFQVIHAADGNEGIRLALENLPDLILCDIMMPGADGHEVLAQLKKHEATSLIPFIFITALAERTQLRLGMGAGADDYITKPFTREEMLQAVNVRIRRSEEISERAEESLQELRTNLITSLPHELRTPLNGILGFGQLLKNHADSFAPEEIPEIGERIYESAMRLFRLIQNYLLYAQLELKKSGPEAVYRLEKSNSITEQMAKKKADQYNRQADLDVQLEKAVVFISELEFTKVVEELTDNAFKFSKPGQKVMIRSFVSNGRYHLRIEDQGIGIKAEDVKRIGAFMQFERIMNEQQGFGLGLIISRRIVELFNGDFNIQGHPGSGTAVEISFRGEAVKA
jgi:signal transduction histidine kinase